MFKRFPTNFSLEKQGDQMVALFIVRTSDIDVQGIPENTTDRQENPIFEAKYYDGD